MKELILNEVIFLNIKKYKGQRLKKICSVVSPHVEKISSKLFKFLKNYFKILRNMWC